MTNINIINILYFYLDNCILCTWFIIAVFWNKDYFFWELKKYSFYTTVDILNQNIWEFCIFYFNILGEFHYHWSTENTEL